MNRSKINFARNLVTLRSLKEMTQQELADEIHVTRQTVSTWERGGGKPDIYSLGDLCDLFDVTPTKMLYGNMLTDDVSNAGKSVIEKKEYEEDYTYEVNMIMDEDLEEILGIIRYDFDRIIVIALELHRRGYKITEIFNNGFSVLTKSTDDGKKLNADLNDIIDAIIHGDNQFIESRYMEISDKFNDAKSQIIDEVMKEIWGDYPSSFKYYWLDELENPRGYANTEEECLRQAREQLCSWYKVMKSV